MISTYTRPLPLIIRDNTLSVSKNMWSNKMVALSYLNCILLPFGKLGSILMEIREN